MTEKQTQLISAVINTLDQIEVPSRLTEAVSIPVYNCTNALRQMLMEDQKVKQEQVKEEIKEVKTEDEKAPEPIEN